MTASATATVHRLWRGCSARTGIGGDSAAPCVATGSADSTGFADARLFEGEARARGGIDGREKRGRGVGVLAAGVVWVRFHSVDHPQASWSLVVAGFTGHVHREKRGWLY